MKPVVESRFHGVVINELAGADVLLGFVDGGKQGDFLADIPEVCVMRQTLEGMDNLISDGSHGIVIHQFRGLVKLSF